MVAWLICFIKNVSSVFRLADCTLEKQLSLVSAGSNGCEPKGRFLQLRTQCDNLWSMFHSVCCPFHAKRCRLSHREESSVSLTIYVSLTQALFRCSSLNGWTEYADVITKFSGIDRFEKENKCKNRGRPSYKLSCLLKNSGIASQNIAMKEQYTL